MRKNKVISCPKCHCRNYRIIARRRGFSFDKAANGAILGGLIGGHSVGLSLLMGIDGKVKKTYLQCDRCCHVWSVK